MKWEKRGLLFQAPGTSEWLTSHAALPAADALPNGEMAVYFCGRDSRGRSQIGRFDFNPLDPWNTLHLHPRPQLTLGPLGAFDDSGVTSACIVTHDGRKYQYYSGWSLGVTVPFYFYIGLAVSENGGASFEKISPAPILGRDRTDPFLTASPCVLVENGVWRMWYVSCVKWGLEDGKPKHYYHIKHAESFDGIHWSAERPVCIDFAGPHEYAIGRPCVRKEGGIYRMWFCSRGEAYRAGYAESADGLTWQRLDHEAGIEPSSTGWDSEMIAYPWVFRSNAKMYLLYNGNGYGRTGIGLAEASGP